MIYENLLIPKYWSSRRHNASASAEQKTRNSNRCITILLQ